MPSTLLVLAAACFCLGAAAGQDWLPGSVDLYRFVSRPDLRPSRFNVSIYRAKDVTPGYWFTCPYPDLRARIPSTQYQTGQAGPHIYDNRGELIWSGAHLFHDRATFDFKVAEFNNSQYLTFVAAENLNTNSEAAGAGLIMDSSYKVVNSVREMAGRGTTNMHEFTAIERGNTALMITFESKLTDVSEPGGEIMYGWVGNNGFSEVDVATGRPIFEWWALSAQIHPSESLVRRPPFPGAYNSPWDFFHLNSVDKNADGDYLISARFTNCIYKISGQDGSIIWRLGGPKSTFKLQGFNFSSQHDARFREENATTTVISFFNNHSDGNVRTANTSSALMVAIDTNTMTAKLLNEWVRPDGQLSKLRGNAQLLLNKNMFVCWSENSYISEHDAKGRLIMEAKFASHRFRTYRAFKFNFTGFPIEPIALKAFVYGAEPETSTTAYYVSWNGATEVDSWQFYGASSPEKSPSYVGSSARTGFETVFMSFGYTSKVFVEALDAKGNILGNSTIEKTVVPPTWSSDEAKAISEVERPGTGHLSSTLELHNTKLNNQGTPTKSPADDATKTPEWPPYHQSSPAASTPSSQGQRVDPYTSDSYVDWNSNISKVFIAGAGILVIVLCWIIWSVTRRLRGLQRRKQSGDYRYEMVEGD